MVCEDAESMEEEHCRSPCHQEGRRHARDARKEDGRSGSGSGSCQASARAARAQRGAPKVGRGDSQKGSPSEAESPASVRGQSSGITAEFHRRSEFKGPCADGASYLSWKSAAARELSRVETLLTSVVSTAPRPLSSSTPRKQKKLGPLPTDDIERNLNYGWRPKVCSGAPSPRDTPTSSRFSTTCGSSRLSTTGGSSQLSTCGGRSAALCMSSLDGSPTQSTEINYSPFRADLTSSCSPLDSALPRELLDLESLATAVASKVSGFDSSSTPRKQAKRVLEPQDYLQRNLRYEWRPKAGTRPSHCEALSGFRPFEIGARPGHSSRVATSWPWPKDAHSRSGRRCVLPLAFSKV